MLNTSACWKLEPRIPQRTPAFHRIQSLRTNFHLNYQEVPGISLPLCTRKCCAKEYSLLVLLERHFSPHSTSVHRAVPVLKGFVAFPVFALCYFHHEYLDLWALAPITLQVGICPVWWTDPLLQHFKLIPFLARKAFPPPHTGFPSSGKSGVLMDPL